MLFSLFSDVRLTVQESQKIFIAKQLPINQLQKGPLQLLQQQNEQQQNQQQQNQQFKKQQTLLLTQPKELIQHQHQKLQFQQQPQLPEKYQKKYFETLHNFQHSQNDNNYQKPYEINSDLHLQKPNQPNQFEKYSQIKFLQEQNQFDNQQQQDQLHHRKNYIGKQQQQNYQHHHYFPEFISHNCCGRSLYQHQQLKLRQQKCYQQPPFKLQQQLKLIKQKFPKQKQQHKAYIGDLQFDQQQKTYQKPLPLNLYYQNEEQSGENYYHFKRQKLKKQHFEGQQLGKKQKIQTYQQKSLPVSQQKFQKSQKDEKKLELLPLSSFSSPSSFKLLSSQPPSPQPPSQQPPSLQPPSPHLLEHQKFPSLHSQKQTSTSSFQPHYSCHKKLPFYSKQQKLKQEPQQLNRLQKQIQQENEPQLILQQNQLLQQQQQQQKNKPQQHKSSAQKDIHQSIHLHALLGRNNFQSNFRKKYDLILQAKKQHNMKQQNKNQQKENKLRKQQNTIGKKQQNRRSQHQRPQPQHYQKKKHLNILTSQSQFDFQHQTNIHPQQNTLCFPKRPFQDKKTHQSATKRSKRDTYNQQQEPSLQQYLNQLHLQKRPQQHLNHSRSQQKHIKHKRANLLDQQHNEKFDSEKQPFRQLDSTMNQSFTQDFSYHQPLMLNHEPFSQKVPIHHLQHQPSLYYDQQPPFQQNQPSQQPSPHYHQPPQNYLPQQQHQQPQQHYPSQHFSLQQHQSQHQTFLPHHFAIVDHQLTLQCHFFNKDKHKNQPLYNMYKRKKLKNRKKFFEKPKDYGVRKNIKKTGNAGAIDKNYTSFVGDSNVNSYPSDQNNNFQKNKNFNNGSHNKDFEIFKKRFTDDNRFDIYSNKNKNLEKIYFNTENSFFNNENKKNDKPYEKKKKSIATNHVNNNTSTTLHNKSSPDVIWFRNDVIIKAGNTFTITKNLETSVGVSYLKIERYKNELGGVYTCSFSGYSDSIFIKTLAFHGLLEFANLTLI